MNPHEIRRLSRWSGSTSSLLVVPRRAFGAEQVVLEVDTSTS